MLKKSVSVIVLLTFSLLMFGGSMPAFALGEEADDLNVIGIGGPVPIGEKPEDAEKKESTVPEVIELSLDKAIEIALKNNYEMAINQIAIAKAKVSLDEARERAKDAEKAEEGDMGIGDGIIPPGEGPIIIELPGGEKIEIPRDQIPDTSDLLSSIAMSFQPSSLDLARGIHVGPRAAQMSLTIAEKGADFADKVLRLTVEKAYYDVLKAEGELANKKAGLDRAKEQHRLADVSFKVGLVAKSDVMGAQVGVTNAEVQYLTAQNNLSAAMMALAQAMGEEITKQYILTDRFAYEPAEELNQDEYLKEIMKTDLAVVAAGEGFAVAQLDLQQVAKIYSPNVWAYQKSKLDRDNAFLQYQQAKRNLEINVRQAFLNLKTAEKAYGLLEESVAYAKENARLAALRYEAGMGTRLEMEKAHDQLNEMETQCLAMLYNYNLAKTQIRYGIFPGGAGGAGMGGVGY